jgi:hypothetical protein
MKRIAFAAFTCKDIMGLVAGHRTTLHASAVRCRLTPPLTGRGHRHLAMLKGDNSMDHFVVGGDERYAAVLREQMDGEKVALEAKLAEAASEDELQRIQGEIRELCRKHKQALRALDYSLF